MKNGTNKGKTLSIYFRRQVLKWHAVGMVVAAVIIFPCVLFITKVATQREVEAIAESAAKAFRYTIINGDIRNAAFQMKDALHLKDDESVMIREPNLKLWYETEGETAQKQLDLPACPEVGKICFQEYFSTASLLYPIYFTREKNDVAAYLDVKIKPRLGFYILSIMILSFFVVSIIQSAGLIFSLGRAAGAITEKVTAWAKHISKSPAAKWDGEAAPFTELESMNTAISNLNGEIERLEVKAEETGKLRIIREVAHDIKTPLSQVNKWFDAWFMQDAGERASDEVLRSRISRGLRRAMDIVKQVQTLEDVEMEQNSENICNLTVEAADYVAAEQDNDAVLEKNLKIVFENESKSGDVIANITPLAFHRILDNLFRNAVEASPYGGVITVTVSKFGREPCLFVKDQGPGISDDKKDLIFNFDYSTKSGRGTGLGLGIVKKLCDQFDGDVCFLNKPWGTEFKVIFWTIQKEKSSGVQSINCR